jgi:hypothetical protein
VGLRSEDIRNLVKDRLRVNKLVLEVASWVASAVARRVELWEDTLVIPPDLAAPLVLPPALAARAAVLASGDELLDLSAAGRIRVAVAAAGRTYFRGLLLAAARRGRAAPEGAAAGRRRQEGAPRPELLLERLARELTARGLVSEVVSELH